MVGGLAHASCALWCRCILFCLVVALVAGCGSGSGGNGGTTPPPPPPPPASDFTFSASPTGLNIAPGGSLAFQVIVRPLNDFIGKVSASVSGPAGITSSPSDPIALFLDAPQTITVNCAGTLAAGTYTVDLTATSGTLSHSTSVSVTVLQPRPFPGDYFFSPTTPEVPAWYRSNAVYDANLKEVFFGNPAMNEVEAYSTVDGHHVGSVTVPGVVGLSLAPDGSRLAVGTSTSYVYLVDPVALHVTGAIEIPSSVLNPATGLMPVLPFLMASGPMLIEAGYQNSLVIGLGNLLSYDPATGAFAVVVPLSGMSGVQGVAARSLDGNYLAVPTLGQAAQMSVYSAASQTFVGSTPGQYGITAVAANPDGSQFATVGTSSSESNGGGITFWSRDLQQESQYQTQDSNIVYSRDGSYLYANEPTGVLAINAQTGTPAGYQGLVTGTMAPGTLWDTDENNRVYGIADLGAYVSSVAQLQPALPAMLSFTEGIGAVGDADEGPLVGGTQVQFIPSSTGSGSADGLSTTMQAYFGTTPATGWVTVPYPSSSDGGNFLTTTAPRATTGGPVSVALTDASGNAALLSNAFSYGPHAHWIDPSVVNANGGTISTLLGDGLQSITN